MTDILLRHLMKAAAVFVPVALAIAYFAFGESLVVGVATGAALGLLSGAGLVYVVGQLLEPNEKRSKGLLFLLLFGKLALVGVLLWAALHAGVSAVGILSGIAVALAALVVGLNRGSTSEEGVRAMAVEEARIQQELGDNDADSS